MAAHLSGRLFVFFRRNNFHQFALDLFDFTGHNLLLVDFSKHVIVGELDQFFRQRFFFQRVQLRANVFVHFKDDGGNLGSLGDHIVRVEEQRRQTNFDSRIGDLEKRDLVISVQERKCGETYTRKVL